MMVKQCRREGWSLSHWHSNGHLKNMLRIHHIQVGAVPDHGQNPRSTDVQALGLLLPEQLSEAQQGVQVEAAGEAVAEIILETRMSVIENVLPDLATLDNLGNNV